MTDVLLAFDWWSFGVNVVLGAVGLWAAFWIYVWIRYFPIVLRLIGEAPMLVAESSSPLPAGDEVAFPTADGLTLRGTYLKTTAPVRRGVILFGHELNGDRRNAGPYVGELPAIGYDVLAFDFRNHGASDVQEGLTLRPWITPRDTADVRAAVDYLATRPDADPRGVGVLAVSRAAGAALCVAADDRRIRCLFVDGAYPTRATHLLYLRRYIDIYIPAPWTIITRNLSDRFYDVFLGTARRRWGRKNDYQFVEVEQTVGGVRQPVMMVHGERDSMIPVAASQTLRRALGGPAKLWVVPKAKHNGAINVQPEEYLRRMLRFFRLHLDERRRDRPERDDARRSAAAGIPTR